MSINKGGTKSKTSHPHSKIIPVASKNEEVTEHGIIQRSLSAGNSSPNKAVGGKNMQQDMTPASNSSNTTKLSNIKTNKSKLDVESSIQNKTSAKYLSNHSSGNNIGASSSAISPGGAGGPASNPSLRGRRPDNRRTNTNRSAGGNAQKNKKSVPGGDGKRKNWFIRWYQSYISQEMVHLNDPLAIEAARNLQLQQKHLRKLKFEFDSIDIDGSGTIEIKEFLNALGEDPSSPYIQNLFIMVDVNNSGSLEFDEYIRILATYCMFTKDEILKFCFESFDVDHSGTISESEYIELIREVNANKPLFPDNFKKVLEQFDVNQDGVIDFKEFIEMERKFPMILFPAFRLQDNMQRQSLGEREWVAIIEKYRKRMYVEEYKASHGGEAPPVTFSERMVRVLMPCFSSHAAETNNAIKLGAELEARHRRRSMEAMKKGGAGGGSGGSGGSDSPMRASVRQSKRDMTNRQTSGGTSLVSGTAAPALTAAKSQPVLQKKVHTQKK